LRHAAQFQFIPLQNVVYLITLTFLVCKIFTVYINDVLNFKCPAKRPNGEYASYSIMYVMLVHTKKERKKEGRKETARRQGENSWEA